MALIQLQLGAEVDIATGTELADGLGDLKKEMRHPAPIRMPLVGSLVSVGVQAQVLTLGLKPSTGFMYEMVRLTLCAGDDHTVLLGASASLYRGDEANPSLFNVVDTGLAITGTKIYGTDKMWCHADTTFFLSITGVASGTEVIANADVNVWRADYKSARGTR